MTTELEPDDPGPHGRGRSARSRARDADLTPPLGLGPSIGPETAYCTTIWKPQEFQKRVLACRRGIVFAVGGIGSGKSECSALLLLMWALLHPRRKDGTPTQWYVVGPEFSLIRHEQFAKILAHARRLKQLGYGSIIRRVVYGQDPRIVLVDGQILIGRSGDHYQRMEGQEVDGGWLDEGQRQPYRAYATFMSRQRSSGDIRAVVSCSPEDSPGWVWRAISGAGKRNRGFNRARQKLIDKGSGFRVFRWSSKVNTANDEGTLDVIGAILEEGGATIAQQKLRGVFPGTPEAPSLSILTLSRALVGPLGLRPNDALPVVLGVDIGETVDYTWLTVLSRAGVVLYMERFNANTPGIKREEFYPTAQERIEAVARRWRVSRVVIDAGKAGKPIWQTLEKKKIPGIRFEGVPSDAPGRRSQLFEALNLATACGDIRVPSSWTVEGKPEQQVAEVDQLTKEFEELAVTEGDSKRSFAPPTGGHDDGIISLALAWHGLASSPNRSAALASWKQPQAGTGEPGAKPKPPRPRPPGGSSALSRWKQSGR